VERLVQRGYQRDKIKIYPILLGVSGTIYAAHEKRTKTPTTFLSQK
jgi:hypothetical protein